MLYYSKSKITLLPVSYQKSSRLLPPSWMKQWLFFSKMRSLNKFFIVAVVIFTSFAFLKCVQGADILFFGAVGSHSTRLSMFPLMEALAEKGHKVTLVSAFENFEDPQKKSKITYVTPKKWAQSMGDWEDHTRFFDQRKAGQTKDLWLDIQDMGMEACEMMYTDPEYVKWVKSSKFDLVVMEGAANECGLGLVHFFKAKSAVYGTSTLFPWFWEAYGFPDETSSIVDVSFNFKASGEGMSFVERVQNALLPIVHRYKREWQYFPKIEELTRNGLGLRKDELPSFREIEKNISVVFITSHVTIDMPRSLPPHVIPVGGNVVSKKIKPMPKEMENFVNSAKKGLIYISFGTVAEFTNFDRDVQLEFIQALYAFPEIKFLWKASVQINETLPKNVMLAKWAPQQTVLAHPNIKAFITHCGMGSTAEFVHFGVPTILIPVLAEQDLLANIIESRGGGIKLEITTLKQQELEHAISEILNNNRYRTAMTKLSKAFHDRPSAPTETAVWWIEYILRHENSNDYLLPYSINQSWWKRRQIDVWLSLGVALSIISYLILKILWFIVKRICCSSKDTVIGKRKTKSN